MKFRAKIFSDLHLRKHFLICTFLVLAFYSSFAQSNLLRLDPAIKQGIVIAMKHGDAKALSVYFDQKIVLTFSDKTTTNSKKHAELILQDFFSQVDPKNFVQEQDGKSTANNTKFILGDMISKNGKYKVFMMFKYKNGKHLLHLIQFDKQ